MGKLIYKDIKKFTSSGHYHVNIPLDYVDEWVTKNENDRVSPLQMNPDFQRGHVWNQRQQISYVEFLLREGIFARDIYFNHPGWMYNFEGEFVCVDGLQRVTAVQLFSRNQLPVFGGYFKDDIDRIPVMNITLIFHVNNLKTREEVLQWYIEFNSGGTIHTEEELAKVKLLLEKEKSKNSPH